MWRRLKERIQNICGSAFIISLFRANFVQLGSHFDNGVDVNKVIYLICMVSTSFGQDMLPALWRNQQFLKPRKAKGNVDIIFFKFVL